MDTLLIRTEASEQIGAGHLMRCLALAQEWKDAGGTACFLVSSESSFAPDALLAEGFGVQRLAAPSGAIEDAEETAATARRLGAHWIVVDGYQFGAQYQKSARENRSRLLFIDDNGHAGRYSAHLVLNQNIHASPDYYRDRDARTRLLLGPGYALLRREFRKWHSWKREAADPARRVLVTFGGSDHENVTLRVLEALALAEVPGLEVVALVGGMNVHQASLEAFAAGAPYRITLRRNPGDVAELMTWADVAVSSAGSTSWELLRMQLPFLAVIVAENQRKSAEVLAAEELCLLLGASAELQKRSIAHQVTDLLCNLEVRRRLASAGASRVDGNGSARVVRAMEEAEGRPRDNPAAQYAAG
jgi:UDP-2,4-diacetamido-2,4,6-trideoxy-beta-L-altropyranose hydrolase